MIDGRPFRYSVAALLHRANIWTADFIMSLRLLIAAIYDKKQLTLEVLIG